MRDIETNPYPYDSKEYWETELKFAKVTATLVKEAYLSRLNCNNYDKDNKGEYSLDNLNLVVLIANEEVKHCQKQLEKKE